MICKNNSIGRQGGGGFHLPRLVWIFSLCLVFMMKSSYAASPTRGPTRPPTRSPTTTRSPTKTPTLRPSAAPSISLAPTTKFKTVAPTSTRNKDTCLSAGGYWDYLYPGDYLLSADTSKAGMYTTDGDLCIYDTNAYESTTGWSQRWCLGVNSTTPSYLHVDSSGCLRLVNKAGNSYWRSKSSTSYTYFGYLQMRNSGELALRNYFLSASIWTCSNTTFNGYDLLSDPVYASTACPVDSSAISETSTCTTSMLGPTPSPTFSPTYNYGSTTSSGTASLVLSIIMPVIFVVVAVASAAYRYRMRMQSQVIPYNGGNNNNGGFGGMSGGGFNNGAGYNHGGSAMGQGGFPPSSGYPVTHATPIGGGAGMGAGYGMPNGGNQYGSPVPPMGVAGFSAPQPVGGGGMVGTYPSQPQPIPSYQPVPQSMPNQQPYGPSGGVQMTNMGGGFNYGAPNNGAVNTVGVNGLGSYSTVTPAVAHPVGPVGASYPSGQMPMASVVPPGNNTNNVNYNYQPL